MAWSESKAWSRGTLNQKLYQALLDDATEAPARNAKRKKIVHPEDMPWEMARQGLLKHLVNEALNTRMETVDATCKSFRPAAAPESIATLPRSVCTWSKATATTCHQDCGRRDYRHVSLEAAG
jgi:hypothetical protein